jgi:hypothetical protein
MYNKFQESLLRWQKGAMPTIELFHGVGDGATLESLAAYESFGRPVVSERKERDFFREIS